MFAEALPSIEAKPEDTFQGVMDTYGKPYMVRVANNLMAARFDLMKFTPAKAILDDAIARGELKPGGHVIESSSGTFALALSILCSLYHLELTLVTGPVSDIVRWRLENLGAQLHVVEASMNCEGGIQQARLARLHDLLDENPDAFWPQQYTNPLNSESYRDIALTMLERQPEIDVLVGTVGSGGSLFGMASVIKEHRPELRVVAVDHNRSVIFGAQASKITDMCRDTFEQILAMGAGIPMGNVRFDQCDEVHWVPVPKMVQKVDAFHRETGMLVGPSSGAALTVAGWYADQHPQKNIYTVLPDHGVRYVETMFNPKWLSRWPRDLDSTWDSPEWVDSLESVTPGWCRFAWARRTFSEITGKQPMPRPAGYAP